MPNFNPINKTLKFLSSIIILSFIFILFHNNYRSPLNYSLLLFYGYFLLIQVTSLITLLLNYVRNITFIHICFVYSTLILSIIYGLILIILFSTSFTRIINCCILNIDDLKDITDEINFDCQNYQCNQDIIQIALPLLVFSLCTLWSHQQIHNIYRFIDDRKREIDNYNDLVNSVVVSAATHGYTDPYDINFVDQPAE